MKNKWHRPAPQSLRRAHQEEKALKAFNALTYGQRVSALLQNAANMLGGALVGGSLDPEGNTYNSFVIVPSGTPLSAEDAAKLLTDYANQMLKDAQTLLAQSKAPEPEPKES